MSITLEEWGEIFRQFRQVENVRVDGNCRNLEIAIKDREVPLRPTENQLEDELWKHNGNPYPVVTTYLKENKVLVYYQDTLVAFFDIQAYSEFIHGSDLENSIRTITDFFKEMGINSNASLGAAKFDFSILSDSIVLVVDTNLHPLFDGSLRFFVATCSLIMNRAMMHHLPLRGAIGGGDFYRDGDIVVSSGLVDAASYEKEQDWLGAILTPNAYQIVEKAKKYEITKTGKSEIDLLSSKYRTFVNYGDIPWKRNDAKIYKPDKGFFIKPFMSEVKWVTFLPQYFKDENKIKNSNCLYGQD